MLRASETRAAGSVTTGKPCAGTPVRNPHGTRDGDAANGICLIIRVAHHVCGVAQDYGLG